MIEMHCLKTKAFLTNQDILHVSGGWHVTVCITSNVGLMKIRRLRTVGRKPAPLKDTVLALLTTYEAVYDRHMNTWNHLPQEYWEVVYSSVRDDLANHVLKSKGLSVPVPVVDATARRSFNQSRMAALLAEHRQRPPARAAKPSCPDVRDQPVLQGNFGAADGSSWDSVGGEHGAGGAVGQVEDDGSNASWNRSDVGSEEAEDMGHYRGQGSGRG